MDLPGGPAVLGAIIMCVALGAWMLGRWQGSAMSAGKAIDAGREALSEPQDPALSPLAHHAPSIPCQQAARDERRGAFEPDVSLGDLHAEVSAYRRAQQVLAGIAGEAFEFPALRGGDRPDCRYLGLTGHPTCAMPASVRQACAVGTGCRNSADQLAIAVQPASFTRV